MANTCNKKPPVTTGGAEQ